MNENEYTEYCWSSVKNYINGVLDGSIIACKNIKLALEIQSKDANDDNIEIRIEEVERVFKFFSYLNIGPKKQFILAPYQAWIVFYLFGTYYKNTNERKYQRAFLFIARKQGKTTFIAGLELFLMLKDRSDDPESLLILAAKDQTEDTAFSIIKKIIYYTPILRKKLIVSDSSLKIRFRVDEYSGLRKPGMIKVMSGMPNKIEGMNPTSAILDEIHTYPDGRRINVIENALGTKSNPLIFLISTAGEGKESYCAQLVESGRNVLRGLAKDERTAYFLYELDDNDDWLDQKNWLKANPGIGTIQNERAIVDKFEKAKLIPRDLKEFQYKNLNIFVDEITDAIPKDIILSCTREFNDDEVRDLPCYIGVDLAEVRDLTSIVLLWDAKDRIYVKPYFFFVEGPNNVLRRGNKNIRNWINKKYVIKCDTEILDDKLIKKYFFDFNRLYKVKGIYYDPWHFKQFLNLAQGEKGGYIYSEDRAESIYCMSVYGNAKFDWPYRFFEGKCYEKNVIIYPNECMIWNFSNIVIEESKLHNNIMVKKNEHKDPIDGIIGMMNALYG